MIQEPLAQAVEADGQPCSSSFQLTEKLVSNLERKRGLSNSWFRDGNLQGVTTRLLIFRATNAHSCTALGLFCNKSFKKAIETPYKALAQVQNNFKMANTRQK